MARKKTIQIVKDKPIVHKKGKGGMALEVNLSALVEIHEKLNQLIVKSREYVQCDCYKCTDK